MQPSFGKRGDEDVTASEIACFAYCAKAWHLQYVLRQQPTIDVTERRERGVLHHEAHGRAIMLQARVARHRPWLVIVLLLIAALAVVGVVFLG